VGAFDVHLSGVRHEALARGVMASPAGVGVRDRLRFPREEVMEGLRDVVRHPHELAVHGERIKAQCYEALYILGRVAQAEQERCRNAPSQDVQRERFSPGKLRRHIGE
jgi:hypothetical protein